MSDKDMFPPLPAQFSLANSPKLANSRCHSGWENVGRRMLQLRLVKPAFPAGTLTLDDRCKTAVMTL